MFEKGNRQNTIKEGLALRQQRNKSPGDKLMSPEEKSIIKSERKQIRAFLAAIRIENATIGKELAGLVQRIAKLREAQLGIELLVTEFEKKLK
ncbi:hypothetical protein ES703_76048 [subsurface metagenome]